LFAQSVCSIALFSEPSSDSHSMVFSSSWRCRFCRSCKPTLPASSTAMFCADARNSLELHQGRGYTLVGCRISPDHWALSLSTTHASNGRRSKRPTTSCRYMRSNFHVVRATKSCRVNYQITREASTVNVTD